MVFEFGQGSLEGWVGGEVEDVEGYVEEGDVRGYVKVGCDGVGGGGEDGGVEGGDYCCVVQYCCCEKFREGGQQ